MNSQFKQVANSRKGCKYAKVPLILKLRMFKSVIQDGFSIKKISKKLQIKYSTAKTLIRNFKEEQNKVNLHAFGNETTEDLQKDLPRKICAYRTIEVPSADYYDRCQGANQINGQGTNLDKTNVQGGYQLKFETVPRIKIISSTICQN